MTTAPAKPDILIIDDEVQIRRLLRLTLEAAGHRVREAETGALGLNDAAVQRPDAVILDLSLPDMSGLDVLRRLREWSEVPGKVVTHRQLLRDVWGPGHEEDTHYLRVHMANLRKKIEPSANQPAFLKTESGIGYRFSVE